MCPWSVAMPVVGCLSGWQQKAVLRFFTLDSAVSLESICEIMPRVNSMSEGPEEYVLVLIVLTIFSPRCPEQSTDFIISQPLDVSLTFFHSFLLDSIFPDTLEQGANGIYKRLMLQ